MAADKQNDTIDRIADECVAVRLRMLNRVVSNIYDDALRPLELKISQMNILVASAKMGTARPSEIGAVLQLDPSTLSRNLERMQARGWLEVVTDAADGRAQPVRLTPPGRRLLDKAASAWESAQAEVTKLLGRAVVEQIGAATKRIRAGSAND